MRLEEYFSIHGIDEVLSQKLVPLFQYKEYKQGEIILHMGENTNVVCLILKGIVRGYFLDEEGNDVTKCFSKEEDWCCVYNFFQQEPSQYYIEALEDCCIAQIGTNDVSRMIQEYTSLGNLYEKLYQNAFLQVEEKGISFQRMSGKERYLNFARNHCELVKRVKQEYIASYLGLTPSSLSRIKRGI